MWDYNETIVAKVDASQCQPYVIVYVKNDNSHQSQGYNSLLLLYKSLVRPQLEYCIYLWNSYLKQDMETLEKVQKEPHK